jgi:hypothetical protein
MKQLNINVAQKTNKEIGDMFWRGVERIFSEEKSPDILMNSDDADFNPVGFQYLRKQILILGQLQQAGDMRH